VLACIQHTATAAAPANNCITAFSTLTTTETFNVQGLVSLAGCHLLKALLVVAVAVAGRQQAATVASTSPTSR
jgi:hypothetical protein